MTISGIPIIINNRNYVTWPKQMVADLKRWLGLGQIYILDNDSDYPPLLQWRRDLHSADNWDSRVTWVDAGRNLGHTGAWAKRGDLPSVVEMCCLGEHQPYYIVTDPDLDLSGVPADAVHQMHRGLRLHPDRIKCGLSLEINDVRELYNKHPDKMLLLEEQVFGYEGGNWITPLGDGYFDAPVDTTLAMYDIRRKMTPGDFDRSLRCDRPYTARHATWYITRENLTDEIKYYIEHSVGSSSFAAKSRQNAAELFKPIG